MALNGARVDASQQAATFAVYSRNATRIDLWLYGRPKGEDEVERVPLTRDATGLWTATVPMTRLAAHGTPDAVYYGYRAWGPNWPYDAAWAQGSETGFRADVDEAGNRFNPNKLLLDPYALEISHDPAPRLSWIDPNECVPDYDSGPDFRAVDTGRIAPKSVLPLGALDVTTGRKPDRPLRDDVLYEVHVRGLTKLDPSIPETLRGTYRGAGLKAPYLRELGITAVEFLPVFHFASEQNDDGDPRGDNYWGYMTLGYFAPNRRYASDRTPGGPTREFKAMVKAFHDADIKVFLDVVYNHTGEGLLHRTTEGDDSRMDDARQLADRARILGWRGLDNATYYTLRSRPDLDGGRRNQRYQDSSACGPSLNVASEVVRDFVVDSLRHWANEMGVDGFRFDLAPVLGNRLREEGFVFDWSDSGSLLQAIGREIPLRRHGVAGVDLIAEPWAVGGGTYQLGRFPDGWAEWNDVYRKAIRQAENKLHVTTVLPWQVANAVSGSDQQFRQPGVRADARPWNSLNYVASHDGLTLRDVFAYSEGEDAWDHGGARPRQRKAVRNALALLLTSAGVPMFMGGDELFRTQGGRANTVAVDDESVYLDWTNVQAYLRAQAEGDLARVAKLRQEDDVLTYEFTCAMIALRRQHPSLRPDGYFTGRDVAGSGLEDIAWYGADGRKFSAWNDPACRFIGYRIDASGTSGSPAARSIYVGYNWNDAFTTIGLPSNLPGARWVRFADTAEWMEPVANVDRDGTVIDREYGLHERSVAVFVER
jgi:glycogen operon protein